MPRWIAVVNDRRLEPGFPDSMSSSGVPHTTMTASSPIVVNALVSWSPF